MEIIDPDVIWIGDKCFRKLSIKKTETNSRQTNSNAIQPLPARNMPMDNFNDDDDDNLDDDLPIEQSDARFYATHHVPQCLVGFLIGKKFATKNRIEAQTAAKLTIPNKKKDIVDVAIVGETRQSVALAYRKIESILSDGRWKIGDYTHFVSIPVNSEEIQDGFKKFKKKVLSSCKSSDGIREHMFVNPATLHVTVAMLTLFNIREIETAKELLLKQQKEISEIVRGRPFRIEVKGVEYMNDDPGEITVLYGKVEETNSDNSLQLIAEKISKAFASVNFSRKDGPVKLHVTLLKADNDDQGKRMTFDGRSILEKYADYSFGQMTISEIHISIRFTARDGYYYKSSFVLPLDS